MANGLATALAQIFPALNHRPAQIAVMSGIIIGLSMINILGVNFSKIINNIATVGKVIPLILFIVVGIFFVKISNFHPIVPANFSNQNFGSAALLIFYAFTGFESIAVASEVLKNLYHAQL